VYRFYSIWSLNTISFSLFFVVLNYHWSSSFLTGSLFLVRELIYRW
jgi:hypothetical protein